MNQQGCSPGFATDEVLMINDGMQGKCETPMLAWIAIGTILTTVKVLSAIGHWSLWYRREVNMRQKRAMSLQYADWRCVNRRLPLVPILTTINSLTFVLFFTLTGLNYASIRNGASSFLFGLMWACFGVTSLLFLVKFVSLGKRMADFGDSDGAILRLDKRGKVGVVLTRFSLLGQTIAFCVFGLLFPNRYEVLQVGFGLQGFFNLFLIGSEIIHVQRLKDAIMKSYETKAKQVDQRGAKELLRVFAKLREQQLAVGVCGILSIVFYGLLVSKVLLAHYYIFTIFMWLDGIAMLGIILSNYLYIYRKHRIAKRNFNAENNNNGSGNKSQRSEAKVAAADLARKLEMAPNVDAQQSEQMSET